MDILVTKSTWRLKFVRLVITNTYDRINASKHVAFVYLCFSYFIIYWITFIQKCCNLLKTKKSVFFLNKKKLWNRYLRSCEVYTAVKKAANAVNKLHKFEQVAWKHWVGYYLFITFHRNPPSQKKAIAQKHVISPSKHPTVWDNIYAF